MMTAVGLEGRWQLYRLLGEPFRLRLLALAREEELAMGELAELLDESLPNVSRHAAALRQAGLLSERRHGTRSFMRLTAGMGQIRS
jgi:ArsR family transcriptional regulator